MPKLCLISGDQLSEQLAGLSHIQPDQDYVLIAELAAETQYVWHHVQKIALIFSAMRHFAKKLADDGYNVSYLQFDPESKIRTFSDAVEMHCKQHDISQVVLTRPGEWRVLEEFEKLESRIGVPVKIYQDDRLICSPERFAHWAEGRKSLRMEFFYREMRRTTGLLMQSNGAPVGDQWNFDADNRKKWHGEPPASTPMQFRPDEITAEVLELVATHFDGFGDLEEFNYAVTPEQARRALAHFIKAALPWFGDFQDALPNNEAYLFHSRLSAYLNIGLLEPIEVCQAVEQAWRDGTVPLNAAEGFIRQIIGWREFIRGIYQRYSDEQEQRNAFNNTRSMNDKWFTGETGMPPLDDAIKKALRLGWTHHIERLMVLSNFMNLCEIQPKQAHDWFM
ncbi:MAG: cryptochrome/photolyase family protein, partial [Pseudomonadota bacterium]